MGDITIQLQRDTENCLAEKAKQGGQTLESYIQHLVEQHVQPAVNDVASRMDEEELDERPWRGLFVPHRPRDILFSLEPAALSKRQPRMNMAWHRQAANDE